MKNLVIKSFQVLIYTFFGVLLFNASGLYAQNTSSVKGQVFDKKSNQPVPFATIRLEKISGQTSTLVTGTISEFNGTFQIDEIDGGKYNLRISSIGFKQAIKTIEISGQRTIDAGTFFLQDSAALLQEFVVKGDRIKGKAEKDKSIYFIDKKVHSATGNTPGLLRHIPGVQVDLKQNISVNGNTDILIFVDGKEHDKSYISQLNPSRIAKIEVMDTPPSNYDGNVSGVINIILKKEKISGISGHVFSEIPTSKAVVYSFPTAGINYSYNKVNLYTSYNGEINYEDIDEKTIWQFEGNNTPREITSIQHVRQKNLSHKFNYGIDYHLTSRDVINFYGFYNHYAYEQDGDAVVQANESNADLWNTTKDETDKNQNLFNSLYYKHLFSTEGSEISIDISNAHIQSNNKISYIYDSLIHVNTKRPEQKTNSIRVDFKSPFGNRFQFSSGVKFKSRKMHDNSSDGFQYNERVYAIYGSLNYALSKFDFNIGLRAEDAVTELNDSQKSSCFSLLPYTAVHYKIDEQNSLNFSYRRSVTRPSVYLLTPYSYFETPFNIQTGNPNLSPAFYNQVQLEFATQIKGNFLSVRLFHQSTSNAINNLTYLNSNDIIVTQPQNLGNIEQYGVQLTGSFVDGMVSINPSFRLYNQATAPNNKAKQYGISSKNNLVFETGFSSIISFQNDYALSLIFQYKSTIENIQDNSYSDALYFISLDKTFREKIKVGIVSALPFAKNFVYQGADIKAPGFSSEYTGNLKLPKIPLMFRINYQFNTGKNRNKISRTMEQVDRKPKQGL